MFDWTKEFQEDGKVFEPNYFRYTNIANKPRNTPLIIQIVLESASILLDFSLNFISFACKEITKLTLRGAACEIIKFWRFKICNLLSVNGGWIKMMIQCSGMINDLCQSQFRFFFWNFTGKIFWFTFGGRAWLISWLRIRLAYFILIYVTQFTWMAWPLTTILTAHTVGRSSF